MKAVQEIYFFKQSKNLKKIENSFAELQSLNPKKRKEPKTHKEISKCVQDIVTSLYHEFNFDPNESSVVLYYSSEFIFETTFGFYTLPLDARKFATVDKKKQIFKFNSKYAPSIQISLGSQPIWHCGLTPRELVAGVLHEIGHSFEWKFRLFFYQTEKMRNIVNFLNRYNIFDLSDDTIKKISKVLYFFSRDPALDHPFNHLPGKDSQEAESFCDQFATIFGYSKELVTFLSKAETKYNIKDLNSDKSKPTFLIKLFDKLMESFLNLIYIRTHPEYGERVRLIIAALQTELNTNKKLSKVQRIILQKQIDFIRDQVEQLLKANDKDSYLLKKYKDKNTDMFNKELQPTDLKTRGVEYTINKKYMDELFKDKK